MLVDDETQNNQIDDMSDAGGSVSAKKRNYAASVTSGKTHSSKNSMKSAKTALGYSPVPKEAMEQS
jgi:hypothetical protein